MPYACRIRGQLRHAAVSGSADGTDCLYIPYRTIHDAWTQVDHIINAG